MSIPKTQAKSNRLSADWWNKQCSIDKRAKNKSLNRYRKHKGDIDLWIKFKEARARFRRTVKEAKEQSWNNFISKITTDTSSSEVWQHIRKLRNKTSSRTIVLKDQIQGQYITEPIDIANTLAIHFARRSD